MSCDMSEVFYNFPPSRNDNKLHILSEIKYLPLYSLDKSIFTTSIQKVWISGSEIMNPLHTKDSEGKFIVIIYCYK